MARNNFDRKNQVSGEIVHLGTFTHFCEDLAVMKMEHKNIPYPNSPVLIQKKPIGKIDEVFGRVDDVYASVKLDKGISKNDIREDQKFEAYKEKFIFKDKFLPREEVEKKKEESDKKKSVNIKNVKGDKKKFNNDKRKFSGDKKNFNNDKSKKFQDDHNKKRPFSKK